MSRGPKRRGTVRWSNRGRATRTKLGRPRPNPGRAPDRPGTPPAGTTAAPDTPEAPPARPWHDAPISTSSHEHETGGGHPLDPLTAAEIRQAVTILRRDRGVGDRWRFAGIELAEPVKTNLARWRAGDPVPRAALVTCWNRDDGQTWTATVSLTGDQVTAFDHRPGVQPNATTDEWHEADAALRAHPDIVAALARRGITELDLVLFDTWTYGFALIPEEYRDRRLGWADVWRRAAPGANPYAHPVNGLHPVIDLNRMELLDVGDTGPVPEPGVMGEYVPRHIPDYQARDTVRPLEITQPEGPSFDLDGYELRWQKWSLRIGFNYREGLVLHQVGYADDGRVRPVAHRLSLAEMVVPYRDASPEHYRRTAFDIGE
ncbi:MAG TPA: hypothetical protein VH089_04065, partial [Streptosporangiaceae bacterium]|nr:hypothetical protein [Streptosporangiaceae bacterium]